MNLTLCPTCPHDAWRSQSVFDTEKQQLVEEFEAMCAGDYGERVDSWQNHDVRQLRLRLFRAPSVPDIDCGKGAASQFAFPPCWPRTKSSWTREVSSSVAVATRRGIYWDMLQHQRFDVEAVG
jgi:hypothetical protein